MVVVAACGQAGAGSTVRWRDGGIAFGRDPSVARGSRPAWALKDSSCTYYPYLIPARDHRQAHEFMVVRRRRFSAAGCAIPQELAVEGEGLVRHSVNDAFATDRQPSPAVQGSDGAFLSAGADLDRGYHHTGNYRCIAPAYDPRDFVSLHPLKILLPES